MSYLVSFLTPQHGLLSTATAFPPLPESWDTATALTELDKMRKRGKTAHALGYLHGLLARDPQCGAALVQGALLHLQAGQVTEALDYFARVAQTEPLTKDLQRLHAVADSRAHDGDIPCAEQPDSRPVFIVGCGRSGTTLLFDILRQHEAMAPTIGYPDGEDHVGWTYFGGALISGLGGPSINSGVSGYTISPMMDGTQVTPAIVRSMRAYYHECVRLGDTTRIPLNKCPHLLNKIGYVRALFPEARFIHIVRDVVPMVASYVAMMRTMGNVALYIPESDVSGLMAQPMPTDRFGRNHATLLAHEDRMIPGNGTARLAEYWCAANGGVAAQMADAPERILGIRYEDLCTDPAATIEKICAFLGIEKFLPPEFAHLTAQNDKHAGLLSPSVVEDILTRSAATRRTFGYV